MSTRVQASPYPAEDILDRLLELKALEDGIAKFFRCDSKFWKALDDYIGKCAVGHCPFVDLRHPIASHRGTGKAISWDRAHAHPIGAGDNAENVIRVCLDVTVWDDGENGYEGERDVIGMVDVPIKLITHFHWAEFDAWIKEREGAHRARRIEDAKRELDELGTRYPDELDSVIAREV